MAEWEFAKADPSDELAQLHFFSLKKKQPNGEVEFQIVIRDYGDRAENQSRRYFAEANRQTNQSIAPYTPVGWGNSLFKALAECVRAVHRFPYEGTMPDDNQAS